MTAADSDRLLRPGETLGGYVIESVAGRGGMGVVYRALDVDLRRHVALKVIAPQLIGDDAFRRRFEREWRVAASLDHPNVVPVYRAGQDRGLLYLAMRYVNGTTLDVLLEEAGRLSPADAAGLTDQAARALDAAHSSGLVHRDVKPGNILLSGDEPPWRVYLADFGLTVRPEGSTRVTRVGVFLGTPAYAAPEQIRGESIDARADVYALGAVFYHCLTGRPPYENEHYELVMRAQLEEPPPRPTRARPDVPPAFDRVVARAMSKDPGARYPSAGDLGKAARAAADGAPLPQRVRTVAMGAAAPSLAVAPRNRRRRAFVTLGVVGVLAVGAGLTAVAIETGRPDSPPAGKPAEPLRFDLDVQPDAITLEGVRVWTLADFGGQMNRIDPRSRRVTPLPAAVDLGGGHFPDITAGSGAVWVAHAQDSGGVDRVDPATGEAVEHIGLAWASAVAAGLSSIWAITAPPRDARDATRPRLVEIDPAGNRIVGRAAVVGGEPSALAVSEDAVWVADVRRASVVRVDPRSHAVQVRIAVGRRPTAVAADGRIVWVLNHGDRSLMRIDPASNEPVGAPISLGKELEDIALARDGLWVAASDATLTRLDRLSGAQVGDAVNVGRPALKLAASPDEDGVWIASAADATVQRFGAL